MHSSLDTTPSCIHLWTPLLHAFIFGHHPFMHSSLDTTLHLWTPPLHLWTPPLHVFIFRHHPSSLDTTPSCIHFQTSPFIFGHHPFMHSCVHLWTSTGALPILSHYASSSVQEQHDLDVPAVSAEGDVMHSLSDISTISYTDTVIHPPLSSFASLATSSTLESVFNEPIMSVAVSDTVEGGSDIMGENSVLHS